MKVRRLTTAVVAVVVCGTATGLAQASNAQGGSPAQVAPGAAARMAAQVAAAQWDVSGKIVDAQGAPVDDLQVAATPVGGGTVAASAITYGGRYALHLPTGHFRVTVSDPDGRYAPLVLAKDLAVSADHALGKSQVLLPAPKNTHAPVLKGVARVGQTLTIGHGAWSATGLRYAYQWWVGDRMVSSAASYTVQAKDLGHPLRVKVSTVAEDRESGAVYVTTPTVAKAASQVAVKSVAAHGGRVVLSVRVSTDGARLGGSVLVRDKGRTVASETVSGTGSTLVTVVVPKVAAGRHTFEVSYTGSAAVAGSVAASLPVTARR